jgi:Lon-like protease
MKRRGVTLIVGTAILAILIALAAWVRVPYVELDPGPTWNTLGTDHGHDVIIISGHPTTSSTGQLRMVTIGVVSNISLWEALRGWLSSDIAVVPREVIYPPGQTQQQANRQDQQQFTQSQDSATTAALRELGYPVLVNVKSLVPGGAAQGHLQAGDIITSVNGKPVTSAQRLGELIQAKPAGTALTIGFTRAGKPGTTVITTKSDNGTPRLGIEVEQTQPSPITVKISLANVGGPSAGMMFALGIVDKLDPVDLTGGLKIAGTGTIDDDGDIGAIGGIPQKMLAAKRDGATIFLAPASNCAEAVQNRVPGLELVKVSTLDDALSALATLRNHGTPLLCSAT